MQKYLYLSLCIFLSSYTAQEPSKLVIPARFFDAARFGQANNDLTDFLSLASKKDLTDAMRLSASSGAPDRLNFMLYTDYEQPANPTFGCLKTFNLLFEEYTKRDISEEEKKEALNNALYGASRYSGNGFMILKLLKLGASPHYQENLPIRMAREYSHRDAEAILTDPQMAATLIARLGKNI